MAETMHSTTAGPRPGGGATEKGRDAKDQAQQRAADAAGQAQEKAQQAAGQARERMRQEVGQRSTQAGEQLRTQAEDMRAVAHQLREQGKDQPAKLAEQAAERAERLGGYLGEADADRILRDLEDFGRRRPLAVALGGLALGFAASRFLRASSAERYRSSSSHGLPADRQIPQATGERAGRFERTDAPEVPVAPVPPTSRGVA